MRRMKKVVSGLISMIFMAALIFPVMAANTGDTEIYRFSVPNYSYYTVYPHSRAKQDTSAMYLNIESTRYGNIYVQARGLTLLDSTTYGATTGNTYNLTANGNGYGVNYVTCTPNIDYSIHSFIYEQGYRAATYAFKSPINAAELINGWWSPDSAYSHVDAY